MAGVGGCAGGLCGAWGGPTGAGVSHGVGRAAATAIAPGPARRRPPPRRWWWAVRISDSWPVPTGATAGVVDRRGVSAACRGAARLSAGGLLQPVRCWPAPRRRQHLVGAAAPRGQAAATAGPFWGGSRGLRHGGQRRGHCRSGAVVWRRRPARPLWADAASAAALGVRRAPLSGAGGGAVDVVGVGGPPPGRRGRWGRGGMPLRPAYRGGPAMGRHCAALAAGGVGGAVSGGWDRAGGGAVSWCAAGGRYGPTAVTST